jgi:ABC-type branched-subunit amino acid transport system substrate-binding protein
MKQETGSRPEGSFAALGAASIQVLAAAVEAAHSADPADIEKVLSDGLSVDTVLGSIEYQTGDKNPVTPVAIVQIENGAFKLVSLGVPENVPAP